MCEPFCGIGRSWYWVAHAIYPDGFAQPIQQLVKATIPLRVPAHVPVFEAATGFTEELDDLIVVERPILSLKLRWKHGLNLAERFYRIIKRLGWPTDPR